MKLSKKDKIQIMIWVEALRSGLFKQGKGTLQNIYGKHCCLGVACELFAQHPEYDEKDRLRYDMPTERIGTPDWLNKINVDFCTRTGSSLIRLNDIEDNTFKQIANKIEKVYLKGDK